LPGIIYFLGHLAIGSSLFPVLIYLFNRRRLKVSLFFKLFILVIVFANISNLVFFHLTDIDQKYFFSFYLLIQNCLLILSFNELYNFKKFYKYSLYFTITLNVIFYLFSLNYSSLDSYNFYSTFSKTIMSILSIIFIIERYNNSNCDSLFEDFIFNLSISIILYNGLQLYVVFFNSIILERIDDLFLYTWPIVQISLIVYYVLLTRAIWKLKN
jgi:hypothetical protein